MPLDFDIERPGEDETVLRPALCAELRGGPHQPRVPRHARPAGADRRDRGGRGSRRRSRSCCGRSPSPPPSISPSGATCALWPPSEPSRCSIQAAGYVQARCPPTSRARRSTAGGRCCSAARWRHYLDRRVGDDDWVVRFAVAMVGAGDLGGPEQVLVAGHRIRRAGRDRSRGECIRRAPDVGAARLRGAGLATGAGRAILTCIGSVRDSGRCLCFNAR